MKKVTAKCPSCGRKRKVRLVEYQSENFEGQQEDVACAKCNKVYAPAENIAQPRRYLRRALSWTWRAMRKPRLAGKRCEEDATASGLTFGPISTAACTNGGTFTITTGAGGAPVRYEDGEPVKRHPIRFLGRALSWPFRTAWGLTPKPWRWRRKTRHESELMTLSIWRDASEKVRDGAGCPEGEDIVVHVKKLANAQSRLEEANATIREMREELAKYDEGTWIKLRDDVSIGYSLPPIIPTHVEECPRCGESREIADGSHSECGCKSTEWKPLGHVSGDDGNVCIGISCASTPCPRNAGYPKTKCGDFMGQFEVRWPSGTVGKGKPEFRKVDQGFGELRISPGETAILKDGRQIKNTGDTRMFVPALNASVLSGAAFTKYNRGKGDLKPGDKIILRCSEDCEDYHKGCHPQFQDKETTVRSGDASNWLWVDGNREGTLKCYLVDWEPAPEEKPCPTLDTSEQKPTFRPGDRDWRPTVGEWVWSESRSIYRGDVQDKTPGPVKIIDIETHDGEQFYPSQRAVTYWYHTFPDIGDGTRTAAYHEALRPLALSEVKTEAQAKQFFGRKVRQGAAADGSWSDPGEVEIRAKFGAESHAANCPWWIVQARNVLYAQATDPTAPWYIELVE